MNASARRGRPPNLERRRQIAQTALRLISRQGYGGCSMRDVARLCDVRPSVLYRYYPDKRAMLTAAVREAFAHYDAVDDALSFAARSTTRVRPFLDRLTSVLTRAFDEMEAWYVLWFLDVPLEPAQRREASRLEERLYQRIAATLEARGTFRDAYSTARLIVGSIAWNTLLQRRAGFEHATPQLRDLFNANLVETIIDGAGTGMSQNRVDAPNLP